MRISDWSSDVCSSDLLRKGAVLHLLGQQAGVVVGDVGKAPALLQHVERLAAHGQPLEAAVGATVAGRQGDRRLIQALDAAAHATLPCSLGSCAVSLAGADRKSTRLNSSH